MLSVLGLILTYHWPTGSKNHKQFLVRPFLVLVLLLLLLISAPRFTGNSRDFSHVREVVAFREGFV